MIGPQIDCIKNKTLIFLDILDWRHETTVLEMPQVLTYTVCPAPRHTVLLYKVLCRSMSYESAAREASFEGSTYSKKTYSIYL